MKRSSFKSLPLYIFAALVFAFLFAPIGLVIVNSFNQDPTLISWEGFTTKWYVVAASNPTVTNAVNRSLQIAIITTLVATVLGTLAAVGIRGAGRVARGAMDATTYARLIVPELVLAIGLLLLFQAVGFPLGFAAVVVGHVTLYTAFSIIIVSATLANRDPATEEAARDLGATAVRAFWRVTLPEIMPGVVASALLVFTFSMDNVVSSLFLSSGGNTLPLVLFSIMRLRVTPEVNAIATALILLTGILLAVSVFVTRGGINLLGQSKK